MKWFEIEYLVVDLSIEKFDNMRHINMYLAYFGKLTIK